jgi:hypothetical protein
LNVPTPPLVTVMPAPARIVPIKFDVVIVAASATHHVTLHGSAPPDMTTLKSVPVRAPVPLVPILKSHDASAGPFSVSVPVSVAAAAKQ